MFLVRISVSADASLFSKYSKKKSSALVLNSYNFTVLRSVFYSRNVHVSQTEIYTFRIFICSLCCFFFLSSPWGSVCYCCYVFVVVVVVFFYEEHGDMPLFMVNDPFSDLPFCLVVKNPYNLRSRIRFEFSQKTEPIVSRLETNAVFLVGT